MIGQYEMRWLQTQITEVIQFSRISSSVGSRMDGFRVTSTQKSNAAEAVQNLQVLKIYFLQWLFGIPTFGTCNVCFKEIFSISRNRTMTQHPVSIERLPMPWPFVAPLPSWGKAHWSPWVLLMSCGESCRLHWATWMRSMFTWKVGKARALKTDKRYKNQQTSKELG